MKLIDRFRNAYGTLVLRAQDRKGDFHDIHVNDVSAAKAECSLAAAEQEAGAIWAGHEVDCWKAEDGSLIFRATPGAMSEDEFADFDFRTWCQAARQTAPQASDQQLRDIYDTPMSLSQRQHALEALT